MRYLSDVAPLLMIDGKADSRLMYAKIFSNRALGFTRRVSDPDRSDHVIGKFGHAVMLSFFHTMQAHIHAVLCLGSPSQVINRVIVWVTIAMYSLVSFWSWADKRIKHEVMYLDLMRNALFHKAHGLIRMLFVVVARLEYTPLAPRKVSARATRPHGAIVTNSVTRKPLDVLVLCAHNSYCITEVAEVQLCAT